MARRRARRRTSVTGYRWVGGGVDVVIVVSARQNGLFCARHLVRASEAFRGRRWAAESGAGDSRPGTSAEFLRAPNNIFIIPVAGKLAVDLSAGAGPLCTPDPAPAPVLVLLHVAAVIY